MGLSRNLVRPTRRQPRSTQMIPNPLTIETEFLKTDACDDGRRIAAPGDLRQTHDCYSKLEKEAER